MGNANTIDKQARPHHFLQSITPEELAALSRAREKEQIRQEKEVHRRADEQRIAAFQKERAELFSRLPRRGHPDGEECSCSAMKLATLNLFRTSGNGEALEQIVGATATRDGDRSACESDRDSDFYSDVEQGPAHSNMEAARVTNRPSRMEETCDLIARCNAELSIVCYELAENEAEFVREEQQEIRVRLRALYRIRDTLSLQKERIEFWSRVGRGIRKWVFCTSIKDEYTREDIDASLIDALN